MRLARKLTIALILAMGLVITFQTLARVNRERRQFASETARYHAILGRSLRTSLIDAWTRGGEPEARALLERTDHDDARVLLTLAWTDVATQNAPAETRARLLAGEAHFSVTGSEDQPDHLVTYTPIPLPDGRVAALRIVEPMEIGRQYVRGSIARVLAYTTVGFTAMSVVAVVLGVVMVGRPMRALASKARRMGDGDLSSPLEMHRADEIGDLATEINAACDRLRIAADKIEAESSRSAAAVEQLRHADRLAAVGVVASGIAHETGTALNVVSERARMIATREAEGEEAIESARVIVRETARITATIRQLLDYGRRRTRERSSAPLQEVIENVLAFVRPLAQRQGIQLVTDLPPEAALAPMDAEQLQHALGNLMVNSIQAMANGGTLRVRVSTSTTGARDAFDGVGTAWWRVDVEDEGTGIPADQLEQIFEAFYTTKPAGEGTGLGLSIARDIVRQHGGRIDATPRPEGGMRFSIHLPKELPS